MAPHSGTFAWKIPWMEEPGRLQSTGSLRVGTTEWLHFPFSLSCIGEGNGNPLQCSCLENPRDEEAWWAAVYGVAQSRRRLKWHSSSNILTRSKPYSMFSQSHIFCLSSLCHVAQLVKNPPATWESWVRSLGWEDPWRQDSCLQYSCLENSMDRGAWTVVHRVVKSQTWLKRLSRRTDEKKIHEWSC